MMKYNDNNSLTVAMKNKETGEREIYVFDSYRTYAKFLREHLDVDDFSEHIDDVTDAIITDLETQDLKRLKRHVKDFCWLVKHMAC